MIFTDEMEWKPQSCIKYATYDGTGSMVTRTRK